MRVPRQSWVGLMICPQAPCQMNGPSSIIITTTRHRPFTARSGCTLSLASTNSRSIKSGCTHVASPTRIKTRDLTTSSRVVTIGRTEATGTGNELRLSTDTRRDSINECPTSLGLHTPYTDSPQLAAARRLLSFSIRATTLMRWHRDLASFDLYHLARTLALERGQVRFEPPAIGR